MASGHDRKQLGALDMGMMHTSELCLLPLIGGEQTLAAYAGTWQLERERLRLRLQTGALCRAAEERDRELLTGPHN